MKRIFTAPKKPKYDPTPSEMFLDYSAKAVYFSYGLKYFYFLYCFFGLYMKK